MRNITRSTLLATAAIGAALAVTPAQAQDFGALYTFGDSLADPGNLPAAVFAARTAPATPFYSERRFSNGAVIPDYLDDLLGATTGTNRAVGGATTRDILGQVNAFIAAGGRIASDDVVFLYGNGPNDYFQALPGFALLPPTSVPGAIATTVGRAQANIRAQVTALSSVGAQRFILGTLPNFATLPQFAGGPAAAAAGGLSSTHNTALIDTANQVSGLGDVTLVDYAALFAAVQADPGAFGFTNATNACLTTPGCATASQAQQNQFFFFDGVHPTTAGQAAVAAATADAIHAPYQAAATIENEELVAAAFGRDLLDAAGATFRSPEFRSADLPDAPLEASVVHYGAVEVSGGYRRIDFDRTADAAAAGFDSQTNRFHLTGAYGTNGLRFGVTAAYDDTDLDAAQTRGDVRSYRGGVFAGVVHGFSPFVNLYASASAQAGYTDYDLSRDTRIARFTANTDTQGWTIGLDGEIRLTQRFFDTVELGPIARLGFVDTDIDGYTETGGPAGLNRLVEDISRNYAYGEIGLGLTHSTAIGFGAVDVSVAALYHDDFNDDGAVINSRAATLPGFVSTIEAGGDRSGLVRLEADVEVVTARGLTIGIDGDASFGDDLDGYAIGASLGYRF